MDVAQVLHMAAGDGETSYSRNSFITKGVVSITKPIAEEAIVNYYSKSLPKTLAIADMGCSSGQNTLLVASYLVEVVHNLCQSLLRESPEFQVHLNDLPGNDFNTIFKSLPSFQEKLKGLLGPDFGPCFFTGIPGSFYSRLFPANSLHFVHSSYSLQWLSQVPKGVENNKGNIWIARTSPPNVIKAYKEQFEKDLSFFLKCRSKELVVSGQMVLTFCGRKCKEFSSRDATDHTLELLAIVLNDMVSEGLIEEEKLDTFNIPMYPPCPSEVKFEVLKEGSFTVNRLEFTQFNCLANDEDHDSDCDTKDNDINGYYRLANTMRSVFESLLISHFGDGIIDEVFHRYREIIVDRLSKEKNHEFSNVTICLTKN